MSEHENKRASAGAAVIGIMTEDRILENGSLAPGDGSKAAAMALVVSALLEAVEELHPMPVPCGTLYAGLMTHGVDLAGYERLERLMLATGKVDKRGHAIYWIG